MLFSKKFKHTTESKLIVIYFTNIYLYIQLLINVSVADSLYAAEQLQLLLIYYSEHLQL